MSRANPRNGQEGAAEAALFAALETAFGPDRTQPIGVAVSGGGDSLALMVLAVEGGWPVRAVTVNHGLRAEAAEEAALVAWLAASLGVPHQVLHWQHGGAIAGNLMEAAREARLALLAGWATGAGLSRVALAHTADDQAETLLMGLSRAAGLDGLSGLRPAFAVAGVTFLRPLLSAARADLRAILTRRGLVWAEDPTNADDRFTRARIRKALAGLAPLGLSSGALARSARNLAAARAALDRLATAAAPGVMTEAAGALRIDPAGWAALDPELARRLLAMAVGWLNGAPAHGPRAEVLEGLAEALAAGRPATGAGVRIICRASGLWLLREGRAMAAPVPAGQGAWDGRWSLEGPTAPGDRIGALGTAALAGLPDWRALALPREVLAATPALWRGETLQAAPLAGLSAGFSARCRPFEPLSKTTH